MMKINFNFEGTTITIKCLNFVHPLERTSSRLRMKCNHMSTLPILRNSLLPEVCQLEGAPQVRVRVEGEGVQVEPHRAREQHRILQDSKLQYRRLHFRALGLGPRKKFYWIKSAISKSFSGNRHDLRSNLCCSTCYLN